MNNWKTTVISLGTAFFAFVVFAPEQFTAVPWLVSLAKFAAAGGLAAFGLVAKDHDTTGVGIYALKGKE